MRSSCCAANRARARTCSPAASTRRAGARPGPTSASTAPRFPSSCGRASSSFTGASADREGWFQLAHRGTLFLDEVGAIPLAAQPKLLRAIQDGEFHRLGEQQPTRVDVRIVAATNADLESGIKDGRFRADLYYRLNVLQIRVPPLRERPEDIAVLARAFAADVAPRAGRPRPRSGAGSAFPGHRRRPRRPARARRPHAAREPEPARALPPRGGAPPRARRAPGGGAAARHRRAQPRLLLPQARPRPRHAGGVIRPAALPLFPLEKPREPDDQQVIGEGGIAVPAVDLVRVAARP